MSTGSTAPGQPMTRKQGIVAEWNDGRGFGFIKPVAGGPRVFAHISAFPRGQRPVTNDPVTYSLGRDERNRLNASDVLYVRPARSKPRSRRGLHMALATAMAFCALLAGLVLLDRVPVLLLVPYGLLSVVGFAMYRADKTAAVQGAWRTPEATLHAVALLGGWPGALVARTVLRHKTRKQPFRTIFWGTVTANCAALVWLVCGMPPGPG